MLIFHRIKLANLIILLVFGFIGLSTLLSCSPGRISPTKIITLVTPEIRKTEQRPTQVTYLFTLTAIPVTKAIHTISPTVIPTKTKPANDTPTYLSTPTQLLKPTPTLTQNFNSLVRLPSGSYIVVRDIENTSRKVELYILSINGDLVGILASGWDYLGARISPDRKYLAYFTESGVSKRSTYIIDLATNTQVAVFPSCWEPAWSPDSSQLAYISQDIHISAVQNGKWVEVGSIPLPEDAQLIPDEPRSSVSIRHPVWSPDGQWLAYYVDFSGVSPDWVEGPYLTDVKCMTTPDTCKDKTRKLSIEQTHQPIPLLDWVFDSQHLVSVFDKWW